MFDLILVGGRVHDGLGGTPRDADVAITGDRVVAIGHGLTTIVAHRDPEILGRTLVEIAGDRDVFDVLCDLVAADPGAEIVIHLMSEDDVTTIMADALVAVGSDNGPPEGLQHPRTWGCFPRFFGEYVRERAVVPLPEAIRKATSAVTTQFGLHRRGVLTPGAIADITFFDPGTIGHAGTYDAPSATPTGIPWVGLGRRRRDRRGRVHQCACRRGHPGRPVRRVLESGAGMITRQHVMSVIDRADRLKAPRVEPASSAISSTVAAAKPRLRKTRGPHPAAGVGGRPTGCGTGAARISAFPGVENVALAPST